MSTEQRKALSGRLRFKTKDDCLVLDREFDLSYLKVRDFMPYSLGIDARERGVKLVGDWKLEGKIVTQIVEWL